MQNNDLKSIFINTYQELANKSISSYKNTSGKFQELTQMHAETLNECKEPHINLPQLTEKFR